MSTTTASPKIPILDLTPEVDGLWEELNSAIQNVLRSGAFIMGPQVAAFERNAAAFLGCKHAIGVNSGTDALVIGLRALGIGCGDSVITTPFTFFATAESISALGAEPIFVDIDEESMNMDVTALEAAIKPNTKAIMPVHLFGRPCNMDAVMDVAKRHNLVVIEDCAQSFGATYTSDTIPGKQTGTIGAVGAYSFFPTKNLGGFGDGGLITTDDDKVAEVCRMLRAHGSKKKYYNEILGYNSRLDTIQAAILDVKLPHIAARNEMRREVAKRYKTLLADVPGVIAPEVVDGHIFHQYTVRLLDVDRDAVQAAMQEQGVSTMVYYPVPQSKLPVYAGMYPDYEITDRVATQVISLPIWPEITEETQARVVEVLRDALKTVKGA